MNEVNNNKSKNSLLTLVQREDVRMIASVHLDHRVSVPGSGSALVHRVSRDCRRSGARPE